MQIRDRIKEFRRVPAGELLANPLNFRTHPESQRKELRKVLNDIGFAGALLAREQDGQLILLDGHMRAQECKDAELPVLVLDVNEEEGNKILASFDPIGSMAKIDEKILNDLLDSFGDDPFGSDAVKESIKPEDDVLVDYEKVQEEEKAKEKEKIEKLKNGDTKFGVVNGDWWMIKPSRYIYCGHWSDPSYRKAIDYVYEKSMKGKYYKTMFLNCPRATENEYMAFEHFLDVSDECWTFTNGDPKLLSIVAGHPTARGVFTFLCGGICQIAVLNSAKNEQSLASVTNHMEISQNYKGRKKRHRGQKSEDFPPAVDGAIIIPWVVDTIVAKFRHRCVKEGKNCIPKFICPSMNTGAMFRSLIGGSHSRVFMAEDSPQIVDGLIQNGFKFRGGGSCGWVDRPPERKESWIIR